jgi:hypothetical protein
MEATPRIMYIGTIHALWCITDMRDILIAPRTSPCKISHHLLSFVVPDCAITPEQRFGEKWRWLAIVIILEFSLPRIVTCQTGTTALIPY